MPTKPELEAEVENLKKELADLKAGDTTGMTAELDKLKVDLSALSDERDSLKANLDKAHEDYLALGKQAMDATALAQKAGEELTALKEVAAKEAVSCLDGDHVMWKGQVYEVHHSNSVKELAIDMNKRQVSEVLTALVIDKVH